MFRDCPAPNTFTTCYVRPEWADRSLLRSFLRGLREPLRVQKLDQGQWTAVS